MRNFDPFVIPFAGSVIILLILLLWKYARWLRKLSSGDKNTLRKGLLRWKTLSAFKEIFLEGLIHRRIWKVNPLLGYMHMSLAFGWFLLIVVGAIESRIQGQGHSEMFWEPIFYKYFVRNTAGLPWNGFFSFAMDFLLLFILSGVALAMIKRLRRRWFGMKKTTRQSLPDQFALISLWAIFPLRLAAESLTAGVYHNGGFLTNSLGDFLAAFLPAEHMYYTFWWAYSIALGTFFVTLPFSRYMHIPTEILLIALRKAGLKTNEDFTGFSWIEVNACPRCDVCVDVCQLSSQAGIRTAPAVYLTRSIRNRRVNADRAFNCLVCGRCQEVCPVKIDISAVRISQRHRFLDNNNKNFSYLQPYPVARAEVAYFAGCMSHLTPTILRAMKKIFDAAGVSYSFIDENGSICCGRPLQLSGAHDSARELIRANKALIRASGARILVTSCPICYKEFLEKYDLDMEILHHTQYIQRLAALGRLRLKQEDLSVVYHDPCELGRGCQVYDEPRELLSSFTKLEHAGQEREMGLCCGGSLGNIMLTIEQKDAIRTATMDVLMESGPDVLVTACPLCKKTFGKGGTARVSDIAEMVAAALVMPEEFNKDFNRDSVPVLNNNVEQGYPLSSSWNFVKPS